LLPSNHTQPSDQTHAIALPLPSFTKLSTLRSHINLLTLELRRASRPQQQLLEYVHQATNMVS
jgi:hypothetical protein